MATTTPATHTLFGTAPAASSVLSLLGFLAVFGVVGVWLHWSAPVALALAFLAGAALDRTRGDLLRTVLAAVVAGLWAYWRGVP